MNVNLTRLSESEILISADPARIASLTEEIKRFGLVVNCPFDVETTLDTHEEGLPVPGESMMFEPSVNLRDTALAATATSLAEGSTEEGYTEEPGLPLPSWSDF